MLSVLTIFVAVCLIATLILQTEKWLISMRQEGKILGDSRVGIFISILSKLELLKYTLFTKPERADQITMRNILQCHLPYDY